MNITEASRASVAQEAPHVACSKTECVTIALWTEYYSNTKENGSQIWQYKDKEDC